MISNPQFILKKFEAKLIRTDYQIPKDQVQISNKFQFSKIKASNKGEIPCSKINCYLNATFTA